MKTIVPRNIVSGLIAVSFSAALLHAGEEGCPLSPIPLTITYGDSVSKILVPEPDGTAGMKVNGQKFYTLDPDGSLTSSVTVKLDSVDQSKLKPRECLRDLILTGVLAQMSGDPEPVLKVASPEVAELLKKMANPDMVKRQKEAMAGASEMKLLLAVEKNDGIFCVYSLRFPKETNAFPFMAKKTEAGYTIAPLALGRDNAELTNLFEATYKLVRGDSTAVVIDQNQ